MNFRRDVINGGPINGRSVRVITMLLTSPELLTQWGYAVMVTAPWLGLTGIIVPYEPRGVRPANENRNLRIPRGL